MRTGGAAGGADVSDGLAARYLVAFFHQRCRQVTVARDEPGLVRDLDHRAVAGLLAREGNDTFAHGEHRAAKAGGDVHALMNRLVTGEGVDALAEAGRYPAAFHGPASRRDRGSELAIEHQAFERHQARLRTIEFTRQLFHVAQDVGRWGGRGGSLLWTAHSR